MRKKTEAAIHRFGEQLYEIKLSSQKTKILSDDLMYNQVILTQLSYIIKMSFRGLIQGPLIDLKRINEF